MGTTMKQIQYDYSADPDAHAERLKEFFGILFDRDDLILIVAGLGDEKHKALCKCLGDWPEKVGGRKTTYFDNDLGHIQPFHFLKPFIVLQASITAGDLAALHEINRQGYGIFFAINPMSCGRRCQKTVTMARHILIESDKNDIDSQLRFLKEYGANIVSAVHSGGKSLHCLVRISPPRPHPGVVGAWTAFRLPKGATKAPWAEYRLMGDFWIAEAKKHGIEIDAAAAHDHSRVSRVPGFLHGKTGRAAEVVRLNPSASWDWRESIGSSISIIQDDDVSFSFLSQKTESFCELGGTLEDLGKTGKDKNTATKKAEHATGARAGSQPNKSSFLDRLDDFDNLRINGLPGRHTRRSMHRALFETARVFKWSETRMAEEWARIIRRNPTATVETVESAVEDMLRAFKATDGIGIYLPDLTKLPRLDEDNMGVMRKRLDELGCKETRKASRIISRVILPLLKARPVKCAKGPIGIKSEALRNAANCREEYRGHKKVWAWMRSANIIKCTDFIYVPGKQARQFRINIAAVLWICGFRTDELVWSPVARNIWPELSRMRVINDVAGDFGAVGCYPDFEQQWAGGGKISPSCWPFAMSAEGIIIRKL
jgi:hypothetical protein